MRVSHSAKRKLEAVAYAETHGWTKTLIDFNITDSMLHDWRKDRRKLEQTQQTRKAFRSGKVKFTNAEGCIKKWYLNQRASNKKVKVCESNQSDIHIVSAYS